jgi:hypothetical protein
VTHGAVGRFAFHVRPVSGGASLSSNAQTVQEDVTADATPGPLKLRPGAYDLTESEPASPDGKWQLSGVQCGAQELPTKTPIRVTIVSSTSTVCTLTNTFTPEGRISIKKTTKGGTATTGFLVSPESGPVGELGQTASTEHPGVPAPAIGQSTHGLKLGRYVIQETTPQSNATGYWELTQVTCNGEEIPFADGQATVHLTHRRPHANCSFVDNFRTHPVVLPPPPPPPPTGEATVEHAALTVLKRTDSRRVTVGQPVSYTLTVTNHGPAVAQQVVVADQPMQRARLLSVKVSQGQCTQALPVSCLIGELKPGQSAVVHVSLIWTQIGSETNHEVVGTSTVDPGYSQNESVVTVKVRRPGPRSSPRPGRGPGFTG